VQTLTVDLAGFVKLRAVLMAIAEDFENGATSGTVGGCTWEIKAQEAVPPVQAPKRPRVRLCACTEGLAFPQGDCPLCGGTGEVQEDGNTPAQHPQGRDGFEYYGPAGEPLCRVCVGLLFGDVHALGGKLPDGRLISWQKYPEEPLDCSRCGEPTYDRCECSHSAGTHARRLCHPQE
jgi:hypothetical protein